MKQKYFFTPSMDAVIREYYDRKRVQPKLSIKRFAEKRLGVPGWRCVRRAAELGLSRTKEKRWSLAEMELLERHAHKAPAVIARHMRASGFPRTATAIILQRKRKLGGVSQNLPFYTACQLSHNFGVDVHSITRWIGLGYLKASRRGTERGEKQGGDMWAISPESVRRFLFGHPLEFDLRKVDQLWFMDTIADGNIGGVKPERVRVIAESEAA